MPALAPVPADRVVQYVADCFGLVIAEGTIRAWASQGHIGRHGKRGRRTLYRLEEVHEAITGERIVV